MPTSAWSTTAASNGATLGIDIAEDCAAANINNALREMMAQLKTKLDAIDAGVGTGSGGSQPLDATLTAFAALVFSANKFFYATGADTFALADITSFGRSLLSLGAASDIAALINVLTLSSVTFASNTIALSIVLSPTQTLLIQGGTGSLALNTQGTITFATAYTTAPVCIVTGGASTTSAEGDIHPYAAATTTGIAIVNSGGATGTYTYLALGKA